MVKDKDDYGEGPGSSSTVGPVKETGRTTTTATNFSFTTTATESTTSGLAGHHSASRKATPWEVSPLGMAATYNPDVLGPLPDGGPLENRATDMCRFADAAEWVKSCSGGNTLLCMPAGQTIEASFWRYSVTVRCMTDCACPGQNVDMHCMCHPTHRHVAESVTLSLSAVMVEVPADDVSMTCQP
jgi:predicted metal-binding protein